MHVHVCVLADPRVMSARLSVSVQHAFVFMCITDSQVVVCETQDS